MTDHSQPDTRGLLWTAVPPPEDELHNDWDEVLVRAAMPVADPTVPQLGVSVASREHERATRFRLRRHRWIAAATATTLLLAAGAAVAAVAGVAWWEDAAPPANPGVVDWQLAAPADGSLFPPPADRSRARTVAETAGAALVAAPVGGTGYCIIPSLPGSPSIGFSCTYQLSDEFRSYARPNSAGTPQWIVYGRITDPQAATLDLSPAAGVPFEVRLHTGGFFLAHVPQSRWNALSETAGEARILDASGTILRSGCVSWGPAPYSPRAGLTRHAFWTDGKRGCRPAQPPTSPATIDVSSAEKLVELTLRGRHATWKEGTAIAVWRAPQKDGSVCVFESVASPPPTAFSGDNPPAGSIACGRGLTNIPPGKKLAVGFSSTRDQGDAYTWMVQGRVDPAAEVSRLEIRTPSETVPVAFSNDYFLAELGTSAASDELPAGPHVLVAYDANGEEIATERLEQLYGVAMRG